MLPLSIKLIFFWLQKSFNRESVSAGIFSKFVLSLLSPVSGEVFLTLLTIFLTLLRRLTLLVRSYVPTWAINDSGFPSSKSPILSTMSPLVAPGIFKTSTFFDLDNPWPLILFRMAPVTTFFFYYIFPQGGD